MPLLTASNATLAGSAPSRSARTVFAPGLQLVGGRGAERVGGAEQHRAAVADQHPGQFAARGGLAGAVHADHEDDRGVAAVRSGLQRPVHVLAELVHQLLLEQLANLGRAATAEHLHLGAQVVHHDPGRRDADVGGDQHFFDLVPGVIVEAVPGQEVQQG
jgi:hypothetical protein